MDRVLSSSRKYLDYLGPSLKVKEEDDLVKLAYSIAEASKASSLGKSTLYRLIDAGRLVAIKIGGRTVIRHEDLQDLLRNGCRP